MSIDPSLRATFTPTGPLRAAINLGNPILAGTDAAGNPCGVSVDLATHFAKRLGVEIELVVFDAAGKSVQAVSEQRADIGFFAIDPLRGESIAFTHAYILIEGCYLVREDSALTRMDQVDRAGTTVTVGLGSAYDLHLTRELKHASIVRSPTSPTVVKTFLEKQLDVAAGVKQQLQADAAAVGGLRLLPGSFMSIRQAMGTPRSYGEQAAVYLADYVEDMKASGFVASALQRHRIEGAAVAPGVQAT